MVTPAKVAIVVPTFERTQYLEQALSSVVAQEWTDWSLTVYDDGRTPEVHDIVRRLGDPRISYHPNPVRLGIAQNKFAGWLATRSRYIANLDDDDTWEPDFLSTLVPILEADQSLAVAFSSQYIIDEAGTVDPERTRANQNHYRGMLTPGRQWPIDRLALVDMSLPVATGSVISRDVLDAGRLPHALNMHADFWLAYLIVSSQRAAFYHDRALVSYRIHDQSATAGAGLVWHASWADCYRAFLGDEALRALWPDFRAQLAISERRVAALQLIAGDTRSARQASRRALTAAITPSTVAVAGAALAGRVGRQAALAARRAGR
jgi:glycosyltransferase involved in cell wall biosynthesis